MALDPWHELRKLIVIGNYGAAKQLVEKKPDVLSCVNNIGETVLHNLAVEGHLEGVQWLHAMGAKLDTRNRVGSPVFFEVALFEHKDLLAWMVDHKVDVHLRNADGDDVFTFLRDSDAGSMATYLKGLLPKGEKAKK